MPSEPGLAVVFIIYRKNVFQVDGDNPMSFATNKTQLNKMLVSSMKMKKKSK